MEVTGRLPSWLRGQLVRTCPADFQRGSHPAQHWFDAHGLLYGFELGDRVRFKQRLLASRVLAEVDRGSGASATFGTDMKRGLLRRLIEPIPHLTDNANVNVVPWQGKWLAMTETPHQHVIDPDTLASQGLYRYDDALPAGLSMSAHPQYDAALGALVNVGVTLGAKSELWVYRQNKESHTRVVEGKLALKRPPYLHSFGLTDSHVLIIDHPLTVNPLKILFSNRSFYSHFSWQNERGTRLWKLDRCSGAWAAYETESLFCFHVVNAFEQGGDVVLDFLAFDDAGIVAALSTAALAREQPSLLPRFVRARLVPGRRQVQLETLSDARFEFPQINYRARQGKPYSTAWGAKLENVGGVLRSQILKVGVGTGELLRRADELTYGEPVFVPRPTASAEDDGVLLTVGSHPHQELTRLAILDARTLEPLASCAVGLSLPLGFHGNFSAR